MGQQYENLTFVTTVTFQVGGPTRADIEKKVWVKLDAYAPGEQWEVDFHVQRQDGAYVGYATATMIDG